MKPPWTFPVKVTVNTALLPSVIVISLIAKEAVSLSDIVTVASSLLVSILTSASPEVIVLNVTITVSLASKIASFTASTFIVVLVLPAGIVTVSVNAV